MARFSLIPKEEQYFALFRQMTSYIYDAARALVEMLEDRSGDYAGHVAGIKSIEHACDELTHSISTKLNSSFITPFDREDIYTMAGALDDIVDLIDDSARAMVIELLDGLTMPVVVLDPAGRAAPARGSEAGGDADRRGTGGAGARRHGLMRAAPAPR